jgi:hypothetical protein
MRRSIPNAPPPQQCCEVCRAARALVLATDALRTFLALGGVPDREDQRAEQVKSATAAWEYAKGGRHTGAQHAPVVVG